MTREEAVLALVLLIDLLVLEFSLPRLVLWTTLGIPLLVRLVRPTALQDDPIVAATVVDLGVAVTSVMLLGLPHRFTSLLLVIGPRVVLVTMARVFGSVKEFEARIHWVSWRAGLVVVGTVIPGALLAHLAWSKRVGAMAAALILGDLTLSPRWPAQRIALHLGLWVAQQLGLLTWWMALLMEWMPPAPVPAPPPPPPPMVWANCSVRL